MTVLVIGLGRFGFAVAAELEKRGHDVIAVDSDMEKAKYASRALSNVLILDGSDEMAIKEAGIDLVDVAVVGIGIKAISNSILTCLLLKEMNIPKVIAKASTFEHEKILKRIGIENVIKPENDSGIKLAKKISKPNMIDFMEFTNKVRTDGLLVGENSVKLIDKTIHEINLRKHFNINIVCIQRDGETIVPSADTKIFLGDIVFVVGKEDKLEEFENKYFN